MHVLARKGVMLMQIHYKDQITITTNVKSQINIYSAKKTNAVCGCSITGLPLCTLHCNVNVNRVRTRRSTVNSAHFLMAFVVGTTVNSANVLSLTAILKIQ